MDKYQQFRDLIAQAADEFRSVGKNETIRVVSHLDSDGICACSLLIRALNHENRKYSISIVHQLDTKILQELSYENYHCYFFTDLGSGQLSAIKKFLPEKKVFVLDHHQPDSVSAENVFHVNPHLVGIDGSKEISGAGVTYLFVTALNSKNRDMAHVAVIGALGDVQEENGFQRLNNEILETAKELGSIEVRKGLRAFGSQTRPIHKLLEYSTDPYIPGVSGSESGAIQFLCSIGIDPKNGKEWKKLIHLSDEEQKRLATAIIIKRAGEQKPEDIFGYTYLLVKEQEESPLKDAKEFSTLLNACGRMDKASLGIGACIGNEAAKQRAIQQLTEYRKEIISAVKWYEENRNTQYVHAEKGFVIINAQDFIHFTFVGTLASILSKSNEFEGRTYILSMAYRLDNTIKVSLRIADRNKQEDSDLRSILMKLASFVGGEAGGHLEAAGAIIPLDKEEEFIAAAKEILRSLSLEERVL
jgi:single-stranded-DNA-specific exonuclease